MVLVESMCPWCGHCSPLQFSWARPEDGASWFGLQWSDFVVVILTGNTIGQARDFVSRACDEPLLLLGHLAWNALSSPSGSSFQIIMLPLKLGSRMRSLDCRSRGQLVVGLEQRACKTLCTHHPSFCSNVSSHAGVPLENTIQNRTARHHVVVLGHLG